jgi:hypothetical protein
VRGNVVARGLLQAIPTRRFKIFPVTGYALTPEAEGWAARQPPDAVQALLAGCEKGRPQVWKRPPDHIEHGFARSGRVR